MSVPLAGGAPTELNRGSHWSLVPNISPDGGRIAFTSDLDGPYELYTIAINGFDVQQLTFTDPPILHVRPKNSPDRLLIPHARDPCQRPSRDQPGQRPRYIGLASQRRPCQPPDHHHIRS